MGKIVHDDFFDGAFKVIKSAASAFITVCSSQPTTRSQALKAPGSAGYRLTTAHAMTASDYTLANDSSGRKCTVGAQNSLSVSTTGSAQHVAIYDGSRLLIVTTCTKQNITSGNKVNIPAWKDNIADPT